MDKRKQLYAILSVLIALLTVTLMMLSQSFLTGPAVVKNKTHHIYHEAVVRNHISIAERKSISKMVMYNSSDGLIKQGMVSIPSVKILLPIYNDAYSEKGLSYGASYANRSRQDPTGHIIPKFGRGNYGLAAHNFNDGQTGFSALQEKSNNNQPYMNGSKYGHSSWLNNQYVYLANGKNIYQYKVVDQYGVSGNDTSSLNETKDRRLTIISCLFPNIENRIITIAILVRTCSWNTAPDSYVNSFNLKMQNTNARANWFNPGIEEGANGSMGGTKK